MKIPYYPGCTLNTVAKGFETSAKESSKTLGFELEELKGWNCCGATFPLTPDNTMALTAPAKVLAHAKAAGDGNKVTTLCSVCYNVLKRTNHVFKEDKARREVINSFIEESYEGELDVVHYLEVLRDTIGFDKVKEAVTRPLAGVKVAAYYGCMLLRPHEEVAIDDHESPTIIEDLMTALGADAVDFPQKIECCGAHLSMDRTDVVEKLSGNVMSSAVENGAELIVTSCPLCQYNLEKSQERTTVEVSGYKAVPIIYFTQLLGLALGQTDEMAGLKDNEWDARPLLKEKGV
ncbi:MAG: CoB--CoM heterodisulfide reductase iron-sulfur subunit B family protein [Deltaproteobacteria bacterium]|nr:CoB--CoM heterodisulfide reductase iron-sulfur subunit B family protein [Deltaproteobacteria bacterium]